MIETYSGVWRSLGPFLPRFRYQATLCVRILQSFHEGKTWSGHQGLYMCGFVGPTITRWMLKEPGDYLGHDVCRYMVACYGKPWIHKFCKSNPQWEWSAFYVVASVCIRCCLLYIWKLMVPLWCKTCKPNGGEEIQKPCTRQRNLPVLMGWNLDYRHHLFLPLFGHIFVHANADVLRLRWIPRYIWKWPYTNLAIASLR